MTTETRSLRMPAGTMTREAAIRLSVSIFRDRFAADRCNMAGRLRADGATEAWIAEQMEAIAEMQDESLSAGAVMMWEQMARDVPEMRAAGSCAALLRRLALPVPLALAESPI